jgi:hypothetical protein
MSVVKIETAKRNIHPVDELAEIREKLRELQAREKTIRDMILTEECSQEGAAFYARVTTQSRESLDAAAVKKEFGLERLRPFLKASEISIVKLVSRQTGDGE